MRGQAKKATKKVAQQGPKLPFLLTEEIGSRRSDPVENRKKGVSMFHVSNRKDARKAARKAKKGRAVNSQSRTTKTLAPHKVLDHDNSSLNKPELHTRKKRRMDPVPLIKEENSLSDDDSSGKESLSDSEAPPQHAKKPTKAKKTHFTELLSADVLKGVDKKAMEAEEELQRKLAKRLGIKAASQSTGPVKVNDVLKEDMMMDSQSEDENPVDSEQSNDSEEDYDSDEPEDLADMFLGDDSADEDDQEFEPDHNQVSNGGKVMLEQARDKRSKLSLAQQRIRDNDSDDEDENLSSDDDEAGSSDEDSDGSSDSESMNNSSDEYSDASQGDKAQDAFRESYTVRQCGQGCLILLEQRYKSCCNLLGVFTNDEPSKRPLRIGIANSEVMQYDVDELDEAAKSSNGTASTSGRLPAATGKYIPPAARLRMARDTSLGSSIALRKQLTGLINKLSDPNLPGVAADVLNLFNTESSRTVTDIISQLLLQAVAEGPRASDRFTCVTAAFVSGIAARGNSIQFGANFTATLAQRLNSSLEGSDSLAASNLGNLISHFYITGLISAACLYTLLDFLRNKFEEQHVAMMHLILKACGLKLRSEDSVAMKDFVIEVHKTAAERKDTMSQRAQIMLELVVDIKNNRKAKSSTSENTLESFLSQGSLRWLKESKVEDVQLRGVTWERLLDPNKKGLWWQAQAGELTDLPGMSKVLRDQTQQYGNELLQLAAKQRMNTDVRRAIFCIIMGSEDYADASERLLKLPLKGESQREIVRVIVECCMQEKDWNPYYAALLTNILKSSQAHCVTAQYCIWDHIKNLKTQQDRRAMNLARLIATLITTSALPFSALRAANLYALDSAPERLFWQTLFSKVFIDTASPEKLQNLLKPLAQPHLQKFAASIAQYLQEDFSLSNVLQSHVMKVSEYSKVARKILLGYQRGV